MGHRRPPRPEVLRSRAVEASLGAPCAPRSALNRFSRVCVGCNCAFIAMSFNVCSVLGPCLALLELLARLATLAWPPVGTLEEVDAIARAALLRPDWT